MKANDKLRQCIVLRMVVLKERASLLKRLRKVDAALAAMRIRVRDSYERSRGFFGVRSPDNRLTHER